MNLFARLMQKLNPAQPDIVDTFGEIIDVSPTFRTNQDAYNKIEVVNRGVNLLVDGASDIPLDVGDILDFSTTENRVRKKKLNQLLNFRPNPYYTADILKRNLYIDLILEGDAFLFFDGAFLFNLPAIDMTIITDKITYIKEYQYKDKKFKPQDIIHVQENSAMSVFEGASRLDSAKDSMNLLLDMKKFQSNFFKNSAVPGLVITTPNPLSQRVKTRILSEWTTRYNPTTGGKKPMLLDGEFKIDRLSEMDFNELDFNDSVTLEEATILKALGVPPILLDSGNNANITPNLKMFYLQSILPLVTKVTQALELYFGYDIKPITQNVMALRPELSDHANYLTSLTNAGVMTRNEARQEIRMDPKTGAEDPDDIADRLILPANIAGSATDAAQGGRPKDDDTKN